MVALPSSKRSKIGQCNTFESANLWDWSVSTGARASGTSLEQCCCSGRFTAALKINWSVLALQLTTKALLAWGHKLKMLLKAATPDSQCSCLCCISKFCMTTIKFCFNDWINYFSINTTQETLQIKKIISF